SPASNSIRCPIRSFCCRNTTRSRPHGRTMSLFIVPFRSFDGLATGGTPLQISVEDTWNVPVENGVEAAHVVACAGVFHELVGVQEVIANLRAESGLGLRRQSLLLCPWRAL